jgi:hypothetical protein
MQVDADRFACFRAAVLDEPKLMQRLRALDDWNAFTTEAVAAAHELGIELTASEVAAERRQAQIGWLARWT